VPHHFSGDAALAGDLCLAKMPPERIMGLNAELGESIEQDPQGGSGCSTISDIHEDRVEWRRAVAVHTSPAIF
jgi:hypothetical protein